MPKPSRADLESQVRTLDRQGHLMARGINALVNHETEFPVSLFVRQVAPDEKGRYTFRFFDADSPDCLKAIVTYSYPGQKDHTAVMDMDEQKSRMYHDPAGIWTKVLQYALEHRRVRKAA